MAYTNPPTVAATDVITAAMWNTYIKANEDYLKSTLDGLAASAVKVNRTSAQSIGDNAWTEVVWNNQLFDLGGWWSSGTDIIVPSDFPSGVSTYLLVAHIIVKFDTDAVGLRGVRHLVNGSVVDTVTQGAPSADAWVFAFTSTIPEAEEADVLTLEVFQDSGSSLDLTGVVVTVIRQFPSG